MTAILSVSNLEKRFGSLVAARNISCDIPAGQTVGVIGANGAGKTTFVNMITGHLKPSSGRILFDGRDITGLPSRTITRLGISRSFQIAQVFHTLSVFDNMCAAVAIAQSGGGLWRILSDRMHAPQTADAADHALESFGIARYRNATAETLPQGVRKVLDIAMAAAGAPRVLLLDEPTSGVSVEERHGLVESITVALRQRNTTILFVEHDMEIVERFADRVLAFYDGTIIADGNAQEVLAVDEVREFITGVDPPQRAATETPDA
jgi:branched-chain amino acid transport system ATP-binding protein